ncbi:LytTR family DNA-binding domain-containing protein [Sedimentibacter sp.]|uniref:LytR/AlgR family response regulator transcription factor n=1 Tax=Sedimentibacter sp. TaxID=1960295 RepID=UPI0028AC5B66|nr:LytTR family DNA-binding domain-containing protein [Sedimentibacter sp.]
MAINIAVCDDSKEYSEIITEIIKKVVNNRTNCEVSTFNSGHDLVQAFKENKFDIIFLDMEMPEINGIETGLKIREMSDKATIFYLTSHKEYAYESYSVGARNYLLKPVSFSIIEKVLDECLIELGGSLNYLDVKDIRGIIHRIPIDDVTHILRKKEDRKLHIYYLDNKEIIVSQTLESVEKKLSDNENIIRSSKSCLVNFNNIKEINKNIIIFINDNKEDASRRCLSELINKFKIK